MTETTPSATTPPQPRYTRLLEFVPDNAALNCPVLAERGGVLLDRQTGQHYLQLKLRNQCGQPIRSVQLAVHATGENGGRVMGRISVPYTDLDCPPDGDFGAKRLIPLPTPDARRFRVAVESVVLMDGSVLRFLAPKFRPQKPPSPPPKDPTVAGAALDRALDVVTPTCIAWRISRRIPQEDSPGRKRLCLTVLRALALCAELCLLLSLVSCNDNPYTGLDLIWQTVSLDFDRFDMWGQAAVTICAVLCLFCLGCSFVRSRPVFRVLLPAGEIVAFFTVLMFVYYSLNPSYTLLFGAYLLTLLYLGLFAVSLYGRAAELTPEERPGPVFSQPVLFGSPKTRRCFFAAHVLYWAILYPKLTSGDIRPMALPCLWITLAALALAELRSCRAVTACVVMFLSDLTVGVVALSYAATYSHQESHVFLGLCALAVAAASPLLLHIIDKRSLEETE